MFTKFGRLLIFEMVYKRKEEDGEEMFQSVSRERNQSRKKREKIPRLNGTLQIGLFFALNDSKLPAKFEIILMVN